jgi:hypothetical protein
VYLGEYYNQVAIGLQVLLYQYHGGNGNHIRNHEIYLMLCSSLFFIITEMTFQLVSSKPIPCTPPDDLGISTNDEKLRDWGSCRLKKQPIN